MRSKITTALATVGLTALALTALPGTAQANPEWYASSPTAGSGAAQAAVSPMAVSDCKETFFCFWVSADYKVAMGKVAGDNKSWTAFAQSACEKGTWNDCASSGYNHGTSGMGVRVYENSNYNQDVSGGSKCLPKGWQGSTFTRVYWAGTSTSINDKISSNKWTWDC
jgi:hypothetical protein